MERQKGPERGRGMLAVCSSDKPPALTFEQVSGLSGSNDWKQCVTTRQGDVLIPLRTPAARRPAMLH